MTAPPMILLLINYFLIGVVSLVALIIMCYWNRVTGGSWRSLGGWKDHPSGRSLMGLLTIVFFITFNAAVQGLVPAPIEIKAGFYFLLYIVFAISLAKIGLTIRDEVRQSRRTRQNRKETGHINISHQGQDK